MSRQKRWRGTQPNSRLMRWAIPVVVAVVTAFGTFAGSVPSSSIQWALVSAAAAGGLALWGTKAGGAALGGRHRESTDSGDLIRHRLVMIERVRTSWITGVFEAAVGIVGWIDLSWKHRQDAVSYRPTEASYSYLYGARTKETPAKQSIEAVFDGSGQALLILGEPGSGKTMLLLYLTRELLERAENDTDHPIPVVFHLSTWTKLRSPLHVWLVNELADAYEIPLSLGRAWVDNRQILPLLDGLDTVAAEYREECVKAINSFREEHGVVPIAVSSRTDEYSVLSVHLRLHTAVEIQPLTRERVSETLQHASGSAARVREAVTNDPALAQFLERPVWLSIIAQTRSDDSAVLSASGTLQRRRELLSAYVEVMLRRRDGDPPYSHERTMGWLRWLAMSLSQHGQSEFSLDRLELDWLSTAARRVVIAVSALLVALVVGPFFGLTFYPAGVRVGAPAAGPVAGVIGGGIASLFYLLGRHSAALRVKLHLRWAWSAANGLGLPLLTALIAGVAGAELGASPGGASGLVTGVVVGVSCGLLVGLATSLSVWHTAPQLSSRKLGLSQYLPVVAGLAVGGAVSARWGFWYGVQAGLLVELTALIARMLYVGESERLPAEAELPRPVRSTMVVGAVAAVLYGLLAGLIFTFVLLKRDSFDAGGFFLGIAAALFLGLSIGATAGLFFALGQRSDVIRPAELMTWSLSAFKKGLRPMLRFAGIVGLLAGLTMVAITGTSENGGIDAKKGLTAGLAAAIMITLLGLLVTGLTTSQLDRPSLTPNEGIRRSVQNALLVGLVVGIGVGLIFTDVSYGLLAGLVGGLFFGGMAAFQHVLVRIMLVVSGATPIRYVRFLDYAAERSILRKLGGRYIFVYQLLLEHFASRDQDRGLAVAPRE
jgi:NACHT domain